MSRMNSECGGLKRTDRAPTTPGAMPTSRAAFCRANTATIENVFRLAGSGNTSNSSSPVREDLRVCLNRTNSSIFQKAMTMSNSSIKLDLQRSNTLVLNRHTMLQRTDSLWVKNPKEASIRTLNGKDLESVGSEALRIFYASDWTPAVLHYSLDNGTTWTQPPGTMMVEAIGINLPDLAPLESEVPKGQRLWVLTLPRAPRGIHFVTNDNGNKWDNNQSGKNYVVDGPGSYYLCRGVIKRISLPPGRPIILVEKAIGVQELELSWNPPIDGESDVAGYNVYREGVKTGTLRMEDVLKLDSLNNENFNMSCFEGFRNFTDKGLMGSTKYKYYVTAFNESGDEGEPSAPLVIRTAEPNRPGSVDNFWIDRTSPDSIQLAWATPLDAGGGIVTGYRVFRNGKPIAVVPAVEGHNTFRDDTVAPGKVYCYHITAGLCLSALEAQSALSVRSISVMPSESRSSSSSDAGSDDEPATTDSVLTAFADNELSMEEITDGKKGQAWLQQLSKMIILDQREKEGPPAVYRLAEARKQAPIPKLFENKSHIMLQSFNWHSCHNKMSWYKVLQSKVQQMADANITLLWLPPPSQSVAPQGYMPSKLYNLNSAYGSAEMLKKLIRECQDSDISPMVDFVANHRCGSKQDNLGQWTIFEDPEWGPWAIVSNNKQGYKGVSNETDSGAQSDCAPDINHNNQQVQHDYKKWLTWLFNEVGFKGIRIDMAPGYGINHQLRYIETVECPFTVGEYWSGDVNTLRNYVNKAQRKIAVYDFAFYYVLRRSVENGDYSEMRNNGQLNGLVGVDPGLAVTFLDNHDTEHLDFVGKFAHGDARKILIGYAILLTHPGTPSVYWNHFSDYGDDMTKKLTLLGQIRKEANIISTSRISIDIAQWDGYVAYITGGKNDRNEVRSICIKVGNANGFSPSHGWQHRISGNGWSVWIK